MVSALTGGRSSVTDTNLPDFLTTTSLMASSHRCSDRSPYGGIARLLARDGAIRGHWWPRRDPGLCNRSSEAAQLLHPGYDALGDANGDSTPAGSGNSWALSVIATIV